VNTADSLACARCGARLHGPANLANARRLTVSLALAALILYPLAVGLPVMRIERFGHTHETGIVRGGIDLVAGGEWALGLLILVCSVAVPLVKLTGLLMLCGGEWLTSDRAKGRLHRLIEGTGRWGMMDVLLVAILAALVKLGNIVSIEAGPGALAFALCVILSLLASTAFDPRLAWRSA
jgi:paraquat-inducible protein A